MTDQHHTAYGPRVSVENGVGSVAVQRAYGGLLKHPTLWRGMITIFYGIDPKFDMEVTLVAGRDGTDFVGWPTREYEQNGQKKYKNMVWCHDRALSAATAEAIKQFMQQDGAYR